MGQAKKGLNFITYFFIFVLFEKVETRKEQQLYRSKRQERIIRSNRKLEKLFLNFLSVLLK